MAVFANCLEAARSPSRPPRRPSAPRAVIRKVGDVARRVAPGDQPSAVGQRGSTNSQCQPVERFAMSRPKDIKPDSEEPRDRLPLYPEIGFRHKFTEMIDAPTNAHRYRDTGRSVLVISSGPYGHPAGATGVHARRTATLPEAVGRRQRGSAMFAAKPHEAEQELPKSIPEPRNVTRECRRPVRGRKTWHARRSSHGNREVSGRAESPLGGRSAAGVEEILFR
jgi:hypothetical protein